MSVERILDRLSKVLQKNKKVVDIFKNFRVSTSCKGKLFLPLDTKKFIVQNKIASYKYNYPYLLFKVKFEGNLLEAFYTFVDIYSNLLKYLPESGFLLKEEQNDIVLSIPHYFPPFHDESLSEIIKHYWKRSDISLIISTIPRVLVDYNEWYIKEFSDIIKESPYFTTIKKLYPALLLDIHSFEGKYKEVGTCGGSTCDWTLIKIAKQLGFLHEKSWRTGGLIVREIGKFKEINAMQIELGRELLKHILKETIRVIDLLIQKAICYISKNYINIVTYGSLQDPILVNNLLQRHVIYKEVKLKNVSFGRSYLGYPTLIESIGEEIMCKMFRVSKKEFKKIKEFEGDYLPVEIKSNSKLKTVLFNIKPLNNVLLE